MKSITIGETGDILRSSKILILVAKVAEPQQKFSFSIEYAYRVWFGVGYNYLIVKVFVNAYAFGSEEFALANTGQKLAVLFKHIHAFEFVIDDQYSFVARRVHADGATNNFVKIWRVAAEVEFELAVMWEHVYFLVVAVADKYVVVGGTDRLRV